MKFLQWSKVKIQNDIEDVLQHFFQSDFRNRWILPHHQKPMLEDFDFEKKEPQFLSSLLRDLENGSMNFSHPGYMGVFNPEPLPSGVVASVINSLYNFQLASTKSAPLPIMIEQKLIEYFGQRAGYRKVTIEGHFTNGGTEANITALLLALHHRFPEVQQKGLKELTTQPLVYVSQETHHSLQRAMMVSGLGLSALREIPTNSIGAIIIEELQKQLQQDRSKGYVPLMLVGTLGTTSTGAIDDLKGLAEISKQQGVWFHVDAAYGGGVLLLEGSHQITRGLEESDSFCVDAHKWLAQPFGSSLLVTKHKGVGRKTFSTESNVYMPGQTEQNDQSEPYRDTLQWSRRFMGLSLYFSLKTMGRQCFANKMTQQMRVARYLEEQIQKRAGFTLESQTPLPIVAFTHFNIPQDKMESFLESFLKVHTHYFLTVTTILAMRRKVFRVSMNNSHTSTETLEQFLIDFTNHLHNYKDLC